MPDRPRITLAMRRGLEVLEQGPARESTRTSGRRRRPTIQVGVSGRLRDLRLARYGLSFMGMGEMVEITDAGRDALRTLREEAPGA